MSKLLTESDSDYLTFLKEPLILVLLGLILMNFLNVAIYFCFLLIPIAFLLTRKSINLMDYGIIIICSFSFLYPVFLLINAVNVGSWGQIFGYFIFPPIFYFLGKYLVSKYPSVTTIYFLLFFMCFFLSILPFLANIRSAFMIGFMTERNLRLFWMPEEEAKSATIIGSYFAINMALLPLLFAPKVSNDEKKLALFSILLFAMAIFSILNMSNRAGLFISVISLIAFIFIPQKERFKHSLAVILFLIALVILFSIDAWGVRSFFENSRLLYRLSQTSLHEEGSRVIIWGNAINAIVEHPFGLPPNLRYNIGAEYAHNLWLDVGLRAGILPTIPLLIFTISLLVSIVKIVFSSKYGTFLRVLIAGAGIAFYITFFLEPIMEGFFVMFLLYCFYFGIVVGIKEYI